MENRTLFSFYFHSITTYEVCVSCSFPSLVPLIFGWAAGILAHYGEFPTIVKSTILIALFLPNQCRVTFVSKTKIMPNGSNQHASVASCWLEVPVGRSSSNLFLLFSSRWIGLLCFFCSFPVLFKWINCSRLTLFQGLMLLLDS